MVNLPLPIPVPGHADAELRRDMVSELGVIAAECIGGASAPAKGHSGAAEGIPIHPERRFFEPSLTLTLTGFQGVADHTLPVADEAFGAMAVSAQLPRIKTRKAAQGGLFSAQHDTRADTLY